MHRLYLSLLIVLFGGLASAGGGSADLLSYQGLLRDNNANANGDYEFKFDLWTIANTGLLIDTSTQTLTVTDGLFNAELPFADNFDLVDSARDAVPFELEIGVRPAGSTDPFTVLSRQQLRDAPRARFAASGADTFHIGEGDGGRLRVYDNVGALGFQVSPDSAGNGQFVEFIGEGGNLVFDGSFSGIGPQFSISGPGGIMFFQPGDPIPDAKVRLPADSINSDEMVDEPGVASQSSEPFSDFLPTTNGVLASQMINCPADGYIIAMGNVGMGSFNTTSEVSNYFSISTDGATPYLGEEGIQINQQANISETVYGTQSITKVIPISAGTTTVSLLGRTTDLNAGFYGTPVDLTLLYVPTAYGATVSRGVPGGGTAGKPTPGSVFVPAAPDPLPVEAMLAKQRALEAEMDELRALLERSRLEQAEAEGR